MCGSSDIHAAGFGQGKGFLIMASAKVLLDAFDLLLPVLMVGAGFSWINVVFIFNCLRVNYLIVLVSFFVAFSK